MRNQDGNDPDTKDVEGDCNENVVNQFELMGKMSEEEIDTHQFGRRRS